MSQPLSIEIPENVFLMSAKTQLSKLWFVNNKSLEYLIKAHLARYQEMFGVTVYGFVLMGSRVSPGNFLPSFSQNRT